MKTITTARAKEIASHWHGGQWSSLYQFASSGVFHIPNTLNYFKEIETCLHPEYNLYPGELSAKNEKELNSLKNYMLKQAAINNLPIEFGEHSVYGYLIPYLCESVPDNLANAVNQVSYLK